MSKQLPQDNKDVVEELRVNTLGAFTIEQVREVVDGDGAISYQSVANITAGLTGRAHRLWLLAAYLLVNRDRGVTPQELIDLLWPEVTSRNPAATLQNNVSRARSLFADAGFDDFRNLIKYTDGLYYWAPGKKTVLDIELFEDRVRRIESADLLRDSDMLDLALETCTLYKGDFLNAAADIPWCANLAVYYRTLYKHACKITAHALVEVGRLKEAETLCLQALMLDPAAEEFSVLAMQAFIMDGNPTAALEQYQTTATFLAENYDIRPSASLEAQRDIAFSELYDRDMTEENIRTFLFESSDDEGAFVCSNAVFREIVLLRLREMERSKIDSFIIAITIDNRVLAESQRVVNAKRVAQVISSTLRSSDPFTKVGPDRFLILLLGANEENARKVFDRIAVRFEEVFPRADIAFKVSMVSLGALQEMY